MRNISLEPDPDMRWIYENNHPDYNSDEAKWLRECRARAIASAPQWMIEEARLNDLLRKLSRSKDAPRG